MLWILMVVVLAVVALVAIVTGKGKVSSGSAVGFPYQRAKALFSAAERSFLGVLDQAAGAEYRVFGKVRVADIATVKPDLSVSARQGALNRVASKHFDFVVCRASDLSVLCAVELNDRSHTSKSAQARDVFVVNVCRAINLPLLQVPAQRSYSVTDIRTQLHAVIGTPDVAEAHVGLG
ncbi:MAG: DUF2726 domain-containing protein [Xanthomonadales bacterium]|nr:DUF2726 domain-containing protein [Xanthomonadales bacterium]